MFLSGLAGIGKKILGGMGGMSGGNDAATPAAEPQTGLQRHMGGLSQGLSSLSANLLDQQPQPQMPRRPLPPAQMPQPKPQPQPAAPWSDMARQSSVVM